MNLTRTASERLQELEPRESLAEFHNNSLFLGIMHFQDAYNMDLERLQRCGIHYVLPDGRIVLWKIVATGACVYGVVILVGVQPNYSYEGTA